MNIETRYSKIEDFMEEDEFQNCSFEGIDLTDYDFSSAKFEDSLFLNCNCSMIKLRETLLNNVEFRNTKLTGVDFGLVNSFVFSAYFSKCSLDYAVFRKLNMKKTVFRNCSIREGSFIETDLGSAVFDDCCLESTLFDRCSLMKCDFTTAESYFIDPDRNRIKGAKFSYPEVLNLLARYEIKII